MCSERQKLQFFFFFRKYNKLYKLINHWFYLNKEKRREKLPIISELFTFTVTLPIYHMLTERVRVHTRPSFSIYIYIYWSAESGLQTSSLCFSLLLEASSEKKPEPFRNLLVCQSRLSTYSWIHEKIQNPFSIPGKQKQENLRKKRFTSLYFLCTFCSELLS